MDIVPAASAKLVEALAIHDQVQVFVVLQELDRESRHLPYGDVDLDLDGVRGDLPHSSAHRLLDLGRVVVHQIHLSDVSEKMDVVRGAGDESRVQVVQTVRIELAQPLIHSAKQIGSAHV